MKRLQGSTTHHVYLYGHVTDANTDLLGSYDDLLRPPDRRLPSQPSTGSSFRPLTLLARNRSIQNLIPKENDVFIFMVTGQDRVHRGSATIAFLSLTIPPLG